MLYRESYFTNEELQPVRKMILASCKNKSDKCIAIADVIEQVIPVSDRSEAKTTKSVYFYLPDMTKIRISDHSSGVWIGVNSRSNYEGHIEINADWTAIKLANKLMSIKKQIGEY